MFATQTRHVFQPRYFKRLKINIPLLFGFRGLRFYDNGSQMCRQYAHSKRRKRVTIRISGKRHARIGLVAAQREGALLAPHTYSGTMKAPVFEYRFEEELLKKLPKGMLSSWTTRRFTRQRF